MNNKIDIYLSEILDTAIEIRRHIHKNPELSGEEKKTANYICSFLDKWNIPYRKNIGGLNIVADIIGEKSGDCIALRADMDALPIQETNEVCYKSQNDGIMHACGHDVHTASLLGAAHILSKMKSEIAGSIRLFFQSSEEVLPGGAKLMIDAGILNEKKLKCVIGQHVIPNIESGKIGMKSGMYMASCDEIFMKIIGKGGHAATPEFTVNPVYIAAEILSKLRHINDKNINNIPTILSFGRFIANGKTNVVPQEVNIEGTFRTLDENWRAEAKQIIKNTCEEISKQMSGNYELNIIHGYPSLFNNEKLTQSFKEITSQCLGNDNVLDLPIMMISDDFSFYSQSVPSIYYRIGTGKDTNIHTSNFDIDENAIKTNIMVLTSSAIELLNPKYNF